MPLDGFFGWDSPLVLLTTGIETATMVVGVSAFWWYGGRDRWFGDDSYLSENAHERIKPILSHETILPEYAPPEIPNAHRSLRPAEMGVLLRERVEDIEISATIVDLAVREYIRLEELPVNNDLPSHKSDYRIVRLAKSSQDLLPFERRLLEAIFDDDVAETYRVNGGSKAVLLSRMSGAFWIEMPTLRSALSKDIVSVDKFFAVNPDEARTGIVRSIAPTFAFLSLMAMMALGANYGAGLLALPFIFGFSALYLIGHAMPRRTGLGRELLRRSLGFRMFLLTAEVDEVRFHEHEGLLHEFLPYAMVLRCTTEWTRRFAHLNSVKRMPAWYKSREHLTSEALESHMKDFTERMTSAISELPPGKTSWPTST